MTIVAYRDGILCSDSEVATRGVRDGFCKKITKTFEGVLVGGAGTLAEVSVILSTFENRTFEDIRKDMDELETIESSEAIIVDTDGEVYYLNERRFIQIEHPFHAIGSGMEVAKGALEAGATAEQAVEIACKYVHGCSGPLQKVEL